MDNKRPAQRIHKDNNMRLVLEYTESDGCTYSFTTTLPVELYCDAFFENGKYYPPAILTIDEWFATI